MQHGNKTAASNKTHTGAFAVTFVLLFFLTVAFMSFTDTLPDTSSESAKAHGTAVAAGSVELPVRVVAKDIGLDATVVNPTTTDVTALDTDLERGAVRYPTSAKLGEDGTVLLFGHSSYLPIVYHQYYKTFNNIQNLKAGEIVSVYSGSLEYRYTVTGVRVADATEDVIDLPSNGKHLTLVTCDSFKSKSSRYVVTADLVGTYSLAK